MQKLNRYQPEESRPTYHRCVKLHVKLERMSDPKSTQRSSSPRASQKLSPEQYVRLRSEIATPYKGLRKLVYAVCGASGLIGAFVFLAQLVAGREVDTALPNFALQIGVVALMIWLFRLEQRVKRKQ